MLVYKGKLDGVRKREYQGDLTHYLQFIQQNQDGSLGFLEIKVPSNINVTQWQVGKAVEIPVRVTAMDGKVYYSVDNQPAGMSGLPDHD